MFRRGTDSSPPSHDGSEYRYSYTSRRDGGPILTLYKPPHKAHADQNSTEDPK
jgi:hypothetical protein